MDDEEVNDIFLFYLDKPKNILEKFHLDNDLLHVSLTEIGEETMEYTDEFGNIIR